MHYVHLITFLVFVMVTYNCMYNRSRQKVFFFLISVFLFYFYFLLILLCFKNHSLRRRELFFGNIILLFLSTTSVCRSWWTWCRSVSASWRRCAPACKASCCSTASAAVQALASRRSSWKNSVSTTARNPS